MCVCIQPHTLLGVNCFLSHIFLVQEENHSWLSVLPKFYIFDAVDVENCTKRLLLSCAGVLEINLEEICILE
jgi:hypothetical protein